MTKKVKRGGLLKALQEYNRLNKIGLKKVTKQQRPHYYRNGMDGRWYLHPNHGGFISARYGVDYAVFNVALAMLNDRFTNDPIPAHIFQQLEKAMPFVLVAQGRRDLWSGEIRSLINKLYKEEDEDEA